MSRQGAADSGALSGYFYHFGVRNGLLASGREAAGCINTLVEADARFVLARGPYGARAKPVPGPPMN